MPGADVSILPDYTFVEDPSTMAKGMSKAALIRTMAAKLDLTQEQTSAFFELLSETAVRETKKSGEFTIPGIGRLVTMERRARGVHFVPQFPPERSLAEILKEREAALDAGGGLVSLGELDAQVAKNTFRRKVGARSRRVSRGARLISERS